MPYSRVCCPINILKLLANGLKEGWSRFCFMQSVEEKVDKITPENALKIFRLGGRSQEDQ